MNCLSNVMDNIIVLKFRFRLKAELAIISTSSRVIRITEFYTLNSCYRTVTSTEIFPLIPVTNAMVEAVSLPDGQNIPVVCSPNFIYRVHSSPPCVPIFICDVTKKASCLW